MILLVLEVNIYKDIKIEFNVKEIIKEYVFQRIIKILFYIPEQKIKIKFVFKLNSKLLFK